ncbi:MAG TPA: hypothetical protein VMY78_04585 [Solirubrobacteraceae bacterium]|nr:hypothetical protein [Solirubrobacteraceae bacterium]
MSSSRLTKAVAAAVAGTALATAGAAVAEAPSDTTISVSPRALIASPEKSPISFPGVAGARQGQPLPRGYVAVARDVRISRGAETAFGAMRMTCPKGKTWRTGGTSGEIGVSVLDRRVTGKRSVLVLVSASSQVTRGETATGTVYALCR